jgi:pheromone a factor receptor
MVDLAIGIGIPFLVMMLRRYHSNLLFSLKLICATFCTDFIVQGHRFDILEEIGCFPFTLNIWPAFVILYMPPLLLGLVSATYSGEL